MHALAYIILLQVAQKGECQAYTIGSRHGRVFCWLDKSTGISTFLLPAFAMEL